MSSCGRSTVAATRKAGPYDFTVRYWQAEPPAARFTLKPGAVMECSHFGPTSEVRIDRYVYAPGEGGLGMVLKFVRGAAIYVSGRIAKLAPDSIRLEAPAAIVGVRGTTVAIRVDP